MEQSHYDDTADPIVPGENTIWSPTVQALFGGSPAAHRKLRQHLTSEPMPPQSSPDVSGEIGVLLPPANDENN